MRRGYILLGAGGALMLLACGVLEPQKKLIWNRTPSVPIGLYWVEKSPPKLDSLVVISATSEHAQWAHDHGFVGENWPLLKRVFALPSDEICSFDGRISVNGSIEAVAMKRDASGRKLPKWEGCRILSNEEIFLLNLHPLSLDGRYFGPTKIADVDGIAVPLFKSRRSAETSNE